jgi:hypothetical protein
MIAWGVSIETERGFPTRDEKKEKKKIKNRTNFISQDY